MEASTVDANVSHSLDNAAAEENSLDNAFSNLEVVCANCSMAKSKLPFCDDSRAVMFVTGIQDREEDSALANCLNSCWAARVLDSNTSRLCLCSCSMGVVDVVDVVVGVVVAAVAAPNCLRARASFKRD